MTSKTTLRLAALVTAWAVALLPPSVGAQALVPAAPTSFLITGEVMTSDANPVGSARVQLRNVEAGLITSRTSTDEDGFFTFLVTAHGTYLAELVDNEGRVLGVGDALVVPADGPLHTQIIMEASPKPVGAIIGNTAAAILAAAVAAGVTALTPGAPVSPER